VSPVRRAVAADAQSLTALCLRSKAYWGYDAAFMAKVREEFVVTEDYISKCPVYVLQAGTAPVGFYGFRMIGNHPFLSDLWIEPAYIGRGFGGMLWRHALGTARAAGYDHFLIESDPNAEGFYLRMGAERIGEIKSVSTGRMLPLLKIASRWSARCP